MSSSSSLVDLPASVHRPFQVFVNGVEQYEGVDYVIEGQTLAFSKSLVQEGRLGLWRWFLGAWGIGTYRPNDEIDITWFERGTPRVAKVGVRADGTSGCQ